MNNQQRAQKAGLTVLATLGTQHFREMGYLGQEGLRERCRRQARDAAALRGETLSPAELEVLANAFYRLHFVEMRQKGEQQAKRREHPKRRLRVVQ